MTASARQRSQASAAFAEASCRLAIVRWRIRNPAVASGPSLAPKSKQGEEDATARATSRAERVSGSFPPAIHFRELPPAANSAAIIRPSQELSRFAEHTLRHIVAPRNTKSCFACAETVDDETSLWKTEEI